MGVIPAGAAVAPPPARDPQTKATIAPEAAAALRVAIAGLFAIYISPLLLLFISFWFLSDGFTTSDRILQVFGGFVGSSDESFALVHRALLPLMAGMAPIAFKDDSSARWTTGLMIALILAIAISIFLAASLNDPLTMQELSRVELFGLKPMTSAYDASQLASAKTTLRPVYSFFSRTQEVMSMYLLMLFGLQLANR